MAVKLVLYPVWICWEFFHAAFMHTRLFFTKHGKIPAAFLKPLCSPLFQLHLKIFQFLHSIDHFVFTRLYLKYSTHHS